MMASMKRMTVLTNRARRFLPISAALALVLLGPAACGRDQSAIPAPAQPTAAVVALAPTAIPPSAPTATATTPATPTPTATLSPTPTKTQTPTPTPISPLSIRFLFREQEYPGSDLVIERTLAPGSNYNRYYASYFSEGLKQYGLLTVPHGQKPATGWPVIVFNHGYIPPSQYKTTEHYIAYVQRIRYQRVHRLSP